MSRLEGKVALVTGGARGLGAAHARVFVGEGARVVLGDVNDAGAKEVAGSLGDAASSVRLDVTSAADWDAAVAHTVDLFGRLDVLVNVAGICPVGRLVDMEPEEFARVMTVNHFGDFLGIRAAAKVMGRGSVIINIGSLDAMRATVGLGAYISSKYAIRGLSKTAAAELAPAGIRVLCLHPGAMDTPMMYEAGNELMELAGVPAGQVDIAAALPQAIPVGRVADPAEIAGWSAFLASDAAAYATGVDILVDGGLSLGSASL